MLSYCIWTFSGWKLLVHFAAPKHGQSGCERNRIYQYPILEYIEYRTRTYLQGSYQVDYTYPRVLSTDTHTMYHTYWYYTRTGD